MVELRKLTIDSLISNREPHSSEIGCISPKNVVCCYKKIVVIGNLRLSISIYPIPVVFESEPTLARKLKPPEQRDAIKGYAQIAMEIRAKGNENKKSYLSPLNYIT